MGSQATLVNGVLFLVGGYSHDHYDEDEGTEEVDLLSAILSWSLSLSPVLEEDSGGEVEDEVEVLAGIEENPLSLLRFALFSLFDPRRTANAE